MFSKFWWPLFHAHGLYVICVSCTEPNCKECRGLIGNQFIIFNFSPLVLQVIKGSPSQYVKLNVGGSLHYTTIGTLTKHDNMLRAMFSGRMEVLTDSEGKWRDILLAWLSLQFSSLKGSRRQLLPPPCLLSITLMVVLYCCFFAKFARRLICSVCVSQMFYHLRLPDSWLCDISKHGPSIFSAIYFIQCHTFSQNP